MPKKPKTESFEDALNRLESISERLESGQMPLEEAIEQYEEGVKAYRHCSSLLKKIERKIEVLTKNADGNLEAQTAPDLDETT